MADIEQIKRWWLILGDTSSQELEGMSGGSGVLSAEELVMDEALAAIYDKSEEGTG